MANSKYEYVKGFEQNDTLLPQTWIVIRVDGRAFTRFCSCFLFRSLLCILSWSSFLLDVHGAVFFTSSPSLYFLSVMLFMVCNG